MKKTIILSLCALVALACAKENAPVAGEFGQAITVPAEIEATIDATKLGLDNSLNLFWQPGDEILLRMSGATWTEANNCNIFTAVQEDGKLTFKGELQYVAGKNGFLYAAASNRSIFPVLSSSSQFNYNWYSNQSGLLEDLGKYSVLWAKTDGTKPYGIVKDGDIYKISANFTPFFCLLKFNVAEGLGVAKIVIKANNTLGGEVTIACSRPTSSGFGPATQFALYIQAAIRNWKFGEGFTVASGNGLEFPDTFIAACARELDVQAPSGELQEIRISASASDGKTSLDNLTLSWTEGDQVAAFDGKVVRTLIAEKSASSIPTGRSASRATIPPLRSRPGRSLRW